MRVELTRAPEWLVAEQPTAQRLWPHRRNARYRDDPIAAVVAVDEDSIEVCWIPYSLKWAHDRRLFQPLYPIHTLAVSAIATAGDDYLIGRRAPHLLCYPDRWEFTPSGGVDQGAMIGGRIDLRSQIMREWTEEVSADISPLEIADPVLSYCSATATWVALFQMRIQSFAPEPNDEVAAWRWIAHLSLLAEMEADETLWVPGSQDLFLSVKKDQ